MKSIKNMRFKGLASGFAKKFYKNIYFIFCKTGFSHMCARM